VKGKNDRYTFGVESVDDRQCQLMINVMKMGDVRLCSANEVSDGLAGR
jgi:hypothetical protein